MRALFPGAVKIVIESPRETARGPQRLERALKSPSELFAEYLAGRNIDDPRLVDLFQTLYEKAAA